MPGKSGDVLGVAGRIIQITQRLKRQGPIEFMTLGTKGTKTCEDKATVAEDPLADLKKHR
jgi:hypothetical protein